MNAAQSQATISGSWQEYRSGVRTGALVYFTPTDGGRSTSTRPKSKEDCTVRALALATGVSFDKAYDVLAIAGRKPHQRFAFKLWANSLAPRYTLRVELRWHPFQAVKGESRMNPAKFCTQFLNGRWIVRTAKHVFAVIDGVVLDETSPRPDRCIYGAWEVIGL